MERKRVRLLFVRFFFRSMTDYLWYSIQYETLLLAVGIFVCQRDYAEADLSRFQYDSYCLHTSVYSIWMEWQCTAHYYLHNREICFIYWLIFVVDVVVVEPFLSSSCHFYCFDLSICFILLLRKSFAVRWDIMNEINSEYEQLYEIGLC